MYGSEYLLLKYFSPNMFRRLNIDPAQRKPPEALPPPPKQSYCIMMTPRSGSSRLSDILAGTGALGAPREYFNALMLPHAAKNMHTPNLADYAAMLPRMRSVGQVFGFRITYKQILASFREDAAFHAAFPDLTYFWLIREDIVEQAISASRMVQTGLKHLETPAPDLRQAADAGFRYRPQDFKRRIRRLCWVEQRSERYFARFGIDPVRISYEALIKAAPRDTAEFFAHHLGIPLKSDINATSQHSKVSTQKSTDFANRFKTENARWLAKTTQPRAPMLAQIREIGQE